MAFIAIKTVYLSLEKASHIKIQCVFLYKANKTVSTKNQEKVRYRKTAAIKEKAELAGERGLLAQRAAIGRPSPQPDPHARP